VTTRVTNTTIRWVRKEKVIGVGRKQADHYHLYVPRQLPPVQSSKQDANSKLNINDNDRYLM